MHKNCGRRSPQSGRRQGNRRATPRYRACYRAVRTDAGEFEVLGERALRFLDQGFDERFEEQFGRQRVGDRRRHHHFADPFRTEQKRGPAEARSSERGVDRHQGAGLRRITHHEFRGGAGTERVSDDDGRLREQTSQQIVARMIPSHDGMPPGPVRKPTGGSPSAITRKPSDAGRRPLAPRRGPVEQDDGHPVCRTLLLEEHAARAGADETPDRDAQGLLARPSRVQLRDRNATSAINATATKTTGAPCDPRAGFRITEACGQHCPVDTAE